MILLIIFLSIILIICIFSVINKYNESLSQKKRILELQEQQKKDDYENRVKELDIKEKDLDSKIKYQEKTIKDFDKIITEKCNYYPQLAAIMADILTVFYERSAIFLEGKKHPAITEAYRIRELKKETQKIISEKKILEYQLTYIKTLFPNITDIFDPKFDEENFILETDETKDKVKDYLSEEEYRNLPEDDRNQLALDRYLKSRQKSKWQIGRDYEMYVGYLYEEKGFKVFYSGIIKRLEDLGRDLIVTNNFNTYIVQCKYWSQNKEIHEKHIFQLFGTITLYKIQHPLENIKGVFFTNTNLSQIAKQIANELKIEVIYKELGNFPRIKCNINRETKAKIYHLPFDQQYDSVIIEKDKGEFFAYTTKEATDKGFRRAYKCSRFK